MWEKGQGQRGEGETWKGRKEEIKGWGRKELRGAFDLLLHDQDW